MIYKIKVNKEKSAAFYQLLQSLRNMNVIETIEIVDESENHESLSVEDTLWVKEKGSDLETLEMMKKQKILRPFNTKRTHSMAERVKQQIPFLHSPSFCASPAAHSFSKFCP